MIYFKNRLVKEIQTLNLKKRNKPQRQMGDAKFPGDRSRPVTEGSKEEFAFIVDLLVARYYHESPYFFFLEMKVAQMFRAFHFLNFC